MALKTLIIVLTVIFLALGDHEVTKEDKSKKAVAAEKEKSRSASPGRERGSLQKLTSIMNNRTESERRQNRRQQNSFSKIHQMNRDRDDHKMMNDNEGALTTVVKSPDNDTLFDKMKSLRPSGPTYEAQSKTINPSQASGVFCNFESESSDVCKWQWNSTVSKNNLGFRVLTADDIVKMNESSKVLKFTGPAADADGNPDGKILISSFMFVFHCLVCYVVLLACSGRFVNILYNFVLIAKTKENIFLIKK